MRNYFAAMKIMPDLNVDIVATMIAMEGMDLMNPKGYFDFTISGRAGSL